MADQSLPDPGVFLNDSLVDLFTSRIQQLISDMGREVVFYQAPIQSGCSNCATSPDGVSQGIIDNNDTYLAGSPLGGNFPQSDVCTLCGGSSKISIEVSFTHKSLITRSPQDIDYTQYGENFDTGNVIKLKNTLSVFHDVKNAQKVLVDGDLYIPIRKPVKTGLRDLNFCQSWWMRQEL